MATGGNDRALEEARAALGKALENVNVPKDVAVTVENTLNGAEPDMSVQSEEHLTRTLTHFVKNNTPGIGGR